MSETVSDMMSDGSLESALRRMNPARGLGDDSPSEASQVGSANQVVEPGGFTREQHPEARESTSRGERGGWQEARGSASLGECSDAKFKGIAIACELFCLVETGQCAASCSVMALELKVLSSSSTEENRCRRLFCKIHRFCRTALLESVAVDYWQYWAEEIIQIYRGTALTPVCQHSRASQHEVEVAEYTPLGLRWRVAQLAYQSRRAPVGDFGSLAGNILQLIQLILRWHREQDPPLSVTTETKKTSSWSCVCSDTRPRDVEELDDEGGSACDLSMAEGSEGAWTVLLTPEPTRLYGQGRVWLYEDAEFIKACEGSWRLTPPLRTGVTCTLTSSLETGFTGTLVFWGREVIFRAQWGQALQEVDTEPESVARRRITSSADFRQRGLLDKADGEMRLVCLDQAHCGFSKLVRAEMCTELASLRAARWACTRDDEQAAQVMVLYHHAIKLYSDLSMPVNAANVLGSFCWFLSLREDERSSMLQVAGHFAFEEPRVQIESMVQVAQQHGREEPDLQALQDRLTCVEAQLRQQEEVSRSRRLREFRRIESMVNSAQRLARKEPDAEARLQLRRLPMSVKELLEKQQRDSGDVCEFRKIESMLQVAQQLAREEPDVEVRLQLCHLRMYLTERMVQVAQRDDVEVHLRSCIKKMLRRQQAQQALDDWESRQKRRFLFEDEMDCRM